MFNLNPKIMAGIYQIVFENGEFYIGSTTRTFHQRWKEHKKGMQSDEHYNGNMQNNFNEYGMPRFKVMEEGTENIFKREQHYIDSMNPEINIVRNVTGTQRKASEPVSYQSVVNMMVKKAEGSVNGWRKREAMRVQRIVDSKGIVKKKRRNRITGMRKAVKAMQEARIAKYGR